MKNYKNPTDAEVRKDFPGGWAGDSANKFLVTGRSQQEQEAFNHISVLAKFRKSSSAITTGKLMQYLPQNGLYIYFRYDAKQTIMVIANTGSQAIAPSWDFYSERINGFASAKNVVSGETLPLKNISVNPGESFVFELLK
jgi:glycosidase